MTDETLYLCMTMHRWAGCELEGCPQGVFGGTTDGSIGFMTVFDDVEKLKAAHPDGVEIMKITRTEES
jgi:hypothetical protein